LKKVFITGGAGFIGSYIAKKFYAMGYDVTVYDSFKQYMLPSPIVTPINPITRLGEIYSKISVVFGDTLHKDCLRRALNKCQPDIIVHMASLPLADVAIERTEEAYNSILTSTVNILEIMRDFSHQCTLVYASSSMVYGDFDGQSVNESDLTVPKDIYGSLKLAGEIVCSGYRKRYGIDIRVVRPTAVYGPYDANNRVVYKFITQAIKGVPLTVNGDGKARLDFTYVEDTAQGIFLVATSDNARGETFNIARGRASSLLELADIIKENIGDIDISFGETPSHMPSRGTLDITKAHNLLDFQPKFDLKESIPLYIEHLSGGTV